MRLCLRGSQRGVVRWLLVQLSGHFIRALSHDTVGLKAIFEKYIPMVPSPVDIFFPKILYRRDRPVGLLLDGNTHLRQGPFLALSAIAELFTFVYGRIRRLVQVASQGPYGRMLEQRNNREFRI